MRTWLTYTAARVLLFAAAFGLVYLFSNNVWLSLILGWVTSGLASYVLLTKYRDQMSRGVIEWSKKRQGNKLGDRLAAGAAHEDHLQDAAQEPEAPAEPGAGGHQQTSAEDAPPQGVEDETTPAKDT